MKIYEIPKKLTVTWDSETKAIIDTWSTYFISIEEFTTAVMEKGLTHAKQNGGRAWIVDSSKASGVFSQEVQDFISAKVFPASQQNGIKYFITINSTVSAMTRMNVKRYSAAAGPNGLLLIELNSTEDALAWLKEQSA